MRAFPLTLVILLLVLSARADVVDCRLTGVSTDSDGDGTIDQTDTFTSDANGNLIKSKIDSDNDGTIDSTRTNTYDANGNLLKSETDNDNDGTIDSTGTFTYNANGNLIKFERDSDNDGTADFVQTRTIVCTGGEPIPTLSEWGIILLAAALLGAGIYYLRKERTA